MVPQHAFKWTILYKTTKDCIWYQEQYLNPYLVMFVVVVFMNSLLLLFLYNSSNNIVLKWHSWLVEQVFWVWFPLPACVCRFSLCLYGCCFCSFHNRKIFCSLIGLWPNYFSVCVSVCVTMVDTMLVHLYQKKRPMQIRHVLRWKQIVQLWPKLDNALAILYVGVGHLRFSRSLSGKLLGRG